MDSQPNICTLKIPRGAYSQIRKLSRFVAVPFGVLKRLPKDRSKFCLTSRYVSPPEPQVRPLNPLPHEMLNHFATIMLDDVDPITEEELRDEWPHFKLFDSADRDREVSACQHPVLTMTHFLMWLMGRDSQSLYVWVSVSHPVATVPTG